MAENNVNEKNKNVPDGSEQEKLPEVKKEGRLKRFVKTVTKPVRYAYRKIKESPAAAAFGALGGAGLALGGRVLVNHFLSKEIHTNPEEPIEIPDEGEQYVNDTTDIDEAV